MSESGNKSSATASPASTTFFAEREGEDGAAQRGKVGGTALWRGADIRAAAAGACLLARLRAAVARHHREEERRSEEEADRERGHNRRAGAELGSGFALRKAKCRSEARLAAPLDGHDEGSAEGGASSALRHELLDGPAGSGHGCDRSLALKDLRDWAVIGW